MIKISFKALVRLLTQAGHRFSIEAAGKGFPDGAVVRFVVSNAYPTTGAFIAYGGTYLETSEDRKECLGRAALYYNMNDDCVIAVCSDLQAILTKAKQEAIKDLFTGVKTSTERQDEFGRRLLEV